METPSSLLAASATLTLLVGAMLVLASILRLGFVANFISEPVLIGFKAGIGVVIVLTRSRRFSDSLCPRGTFVQNLLATFHGIPHDISSHARRWSLDDCVCGRYRTLAPKAPAPLLSGCCGYCWPAYFLNLQAHGVELVGHIPQGLPAFTPPVLSLASRLWPGALGIALMSFTETIAAGRAFAAATTFPQANRELFNWIGQCRRRSSGRNARRRWYHPDSGKSSRRRTHTDVRDRYRVR